MINVRVASHFHVEPGGDRFVCRLAVVRGQAVNGELANRIPVAHDETFVLPLIAQHLAHQELVARSWHTVQVTERCHERSNTRVDHVLERPEIHVTQFVLGNIRRRVIAATFHGPVARKMFGAGQDG